MTTRGEINSNFYQIVNVDANGTPTTIKPQYIPASNTANYANYAGNANIANIANVANSVSVANVVGIGNIATVNLNGNSSQVLYGNGVFATVGNGNYATNSNFANFAGNAFSVSGSNVVGAVGLATYATTANSVAGSNVSGAVNLANYATVANSVAGANVSGYVANATHSNVSDLANSVQVANVIGIGNIATVNLTGSTSNVLYGNGVFAAITTPSNVANANYANFAGNAFSVSGSNVVGAVNLANYATVANSVAGSNVVGAVGLATYATTANSVAGSNVSGAVNLANYATVANSVAGANVSGYVANATHSNVSDLANSVTVGNVVGIGNIATLNLNGNANTYLAGNGVFANIAIPTSVANANYANYAGNAFSVSGSNVVGAVNLANYATVANSIAGANVSGTVANANYAAYAGNAFSVSGSNVVGAVGLATYATTANSVAGANVSGQVANALVAGTVYTNAQPNITSLGTITGLISTGNISAPYFLGNVVGNISGNIVVPGLQWNVLYNNAGNAGASNNFLFNASTNVATVTGNIVANYFIGNGSQLTGISSNFANFAGNVTVANQPNITSVGTLTSLSVSGNLSSGNANLGNLAIANYFNGDGGLLSNIAAANVVGNLPVRFDVKNTSGVTLTIGTPIYITGSVGVSGAIEIAASRADTASTMGAVGILEQTLTNNSFGTAIAVGQLTTNTSAYTIGQELFVAPSGGITGTSPTGSGNIVQPIGTVSRVQTVTGLIEVNIWDIVRNPNLDNGNIWVGTTGNGAPVQQILSTANVGNATHANVSDVANSVAGANVSGAVAYATVANSVAGANVSGQVANSLIAGTVYTNAQPNITSVGTLTSLGVSGAVTASTFTSNVVTGTAPFTVSSTTPVTNLKVTGSQQYISSLSNSGLTVYNSSFNGIGRTYLLISTGGNTDTALQYATGITANAANNSITATTFVGNVTGNISGNATFATTAGTVTTAAQPNITSVGTLTSLVVTGNISSGNANLGNAVIGNYFFGSGNNLSNIQGSNVSGAVGLATYATTANSVAGANVSGQVANSLIAGTVYTNAQPNITSVGTLTSLVVTGNISSGNANLGNLTSSNYFSGSGNLLSNIQGANVSGAVAYATTANSVAVANVVGIGNIATTNYNGNGSQVLAGNGAWVAQTGGGGGSPGGSNTQIQFNNSGSFGGNSYFTYDNPNSIVTLTGTGNLTSPVTPATINLSTPIGLGYGNIIMNANASGNTFITSNSITTNTITTGNVAVVPSFGSGNGYVYYQSILSNPAQGLIIVSANNITLSPTNNTYLGAISNVKITGGSSGQVISTDGTGNLSFVAQSGGSSTTDFTPSFMLGGM